MGIDAKVGLIGGGEGMLDEEERALVAEGHTIVYRNKLGRDAVYKGGIEAALLEGMEIAVVNSLDQGGDLQIETVTTMLRKLAPGVGVVLFAGYDPGPKNRDVFVRRAYTRGDAARVAPEVTALQTPIVRRS